jgi:hypothetical protein
LKKLLVIVFLITSLYAQSKPVISFFNEMRTPELLRLFSDSTLVPTLKRMGAEIRMGIMDTTDGRAELLRRLNREGIPVAAWLILPEEKGYWFHAGNGDDAIACYQQVRNWARRQGIVFKAYGLDMELDMNDVNSIKRGDNGFFWRVFKRLYSKDEVETGRRKYAELVDMIHKDGYAVETYYAAFIRDETAIGRTAIQQATKFLDIRTEKDIPMLYSSFLSNGDGLMVVYGSEAGAKAVGIGSVGGGIDTTLPILNYKELIRDMTIASSFAEELHIFSLEGCVQKGYLTKLADHSFADTLKPSVAQTESVRAMRRFVQRTSTVLSYPTGILVTVLLVLGLLGWLFYLLLRALYRLVVRMTP